MAFAMSRRHRRVNANLRTSSDPKLAKAGEKRAIVENVVDQWLGTKLKPGHHKHGALQDVSP
jgi:hypothetical protein